MPECSDDGKAEGGDAGATPPVAFFVLLNTRCAELGLITAKDIARKLHEVSPALRTADVARSVRNWQSGRNVPRPDYYRVVLAALGIDRDPVLRAAWNRSYDRAKAAAKAAERPPVEEGAAGAGGFAPAPEDVAADAAPEADIPRRDVPPVDPFGVGGEQAPFPARSPSDATVAASPGRIALVVALLLVLVLVVGAVVGRRAADHFGLACDDAAGARWDPQRNPFATTRRPDEIEPHAVNRCEGAVRQHAGEPRYWFQLGRALSQAAWRADNRAQAIAAYRRALGFGYAPAALNLGLLYEAERDPLAPPGISDEALRKAADMYALAARAGLPLGLYCSALASLHGWSGAPPDRERALRLAQSAAELGSARARWLVDDLAAARPPSGAAGCGFSKPVRGDA